MEGVTDDFKLQVSEPRSIATADGSVAMMITVHKVRSEDHFIDFRRVSLNYIKLPQVPTRRTNLHIG